MWLTAPEREMKVVIELDVSGSTLLPGVMAPPTRPPGGAPRLPSVTLPNFESDESDPCGTSLKMRKKSWELFKF